jgi:methylated-DNA-[protein]-cysteine S-methyltransferase
MGTRKQFDIPLCRETGSEFQQSVWNALAEIPYGHTLSYGELAKHLKNPNASRAVGAACGANPISIFTPCHRVVGGDGSMTGFAGGMVRKELLLGLEMKKSA